MRLCLIVSVLTALLIDSRVDAKVLTECEAVRELQQAQIPRSLIDQQLDLPDAERERIEHAAGDRAENSFEL